MSLNFGLNLRAAAKVCGFVTMVIGATMFVPAAVSLIYEEKATSVTFIVTAICLMAAGFILFFPIKLKNKKIKQRDGILIVSLVWVIAILLGTIPILICGKVSFIDALFESTSGFTTTGASVFGDVESLPKGLLFWRSFTHWIGGLGIITLVTSVLPMLGNSSRVIAQAESTQTMADRISVKFTDTAKRITLYYICMTILCTVLLTFGDMNLFESLTHTLGIVSTGGFSVLNGGLTVLSDPYSLWVITVFMALGSVNFTLYYYLFSSHWKEVFPDTELRFFGLIILSGSIFITADIFLKGIIPDFGEALTHGTFNFVSILSTTGLSSYNYDVWPTFAKMIIFFAMIVGGCSASTSGGLKVYRVIVAFKLIKRNLSRRLHPSAVVSIKNDEGPMRADFVSAVAAFIFFYTMVIFISSMLLSVEGLDFITTISGAVSCLSNVGPGFNEIGPLGDFSLFSIWGKILLCFNMLAGRLELFGIILLFTKRFWNPDKVSV